jgi:hypothetical protein
MGHDRLGSRPRVVVIVDTPNITKSVIQKHGTLVRPDYGWLIAYARSIGLVTAAVALVNDGVNAAFSGALGAMGYQVEPSHAFDCDDAFVAWTVRLHKRADCVVICSGDHGYCALVHLLKAIHRRIVLCAVAESCNRQLRNLSDKYLEMPSYLLRGHVQDRNSRLAERTRSGATKSTVLPVLV